MISEKTRDPHMPDAKTLVMLESFATDLAQGAARLVVTERPEAMGVHTKSTDTDVVTEMDGRSQEYLMRRIRGMRPMDGVLGEEDGGRLEPGTSGLTWVVDPIDGTVNYLYGRVDFAVSVAVVAGDVTAPGAWWPVAGAVCAPARGVTYHAARGRGAYLLDALGGRRPVEAPDTDSLGQALVATGFSYASSERAEQAKVVASVLPQVRDIRRGGSAALDCCDVAAGALDAYYERGVHAWDVAAGRLIAEEAGAVVSGIASEAPLSDGILIAAPRLHGHMREALMSVTQEGMQPPN